MTKSFFFLLICAAFIAVVKADGLSDISNNLASDLGPLLALFGEQMTRQYLSESTGFIDYFIFAMAPIGIIGTITAVIRVCGSSSLRAFIGRSQEGEGTVEAELCTSTSADVCELFNKGGITRVLGRPDIVELIHTREVKDGEPRLQLFTSYLQRPTGEETVLNPCWQKREFAGSGDALFGKLDFFKSDKSMTYAPKPNLSLNVGVIRLPDSAFYAVALVGFILQAGILVFAGATVWLLGWNLQESSGEASQNYAPGIFIVGTIVLCIGVWTCAALIGQTTNEICHQRVSNSSDVLYWVQPGPQVIGDQTFDSFAYSDVKLKNRRERIWMSSTKNSSKRNPVAVTKIAVLFVLFGYIGQFIGLRGLNAWVSIAQLVITLIMSVLRSFLRMRRLGRHDNCLEDWHDLVAGHELDWLAFDIMDADIQDEQARTTSEDQVREKLRWYITGQHEQADRQDTPSSNCKYSNQLLQDRIQLSYLTGHSDHLMEMESNPHWKDERVRVRAKARHLGAALCRAAAILLQDQTNKDDVYLRVKSGLSYDKSNYENGFVTIKMKPPNGPDQVNWSLDSSQLEAILGLWLWSMISREYKTDNKPEKSSGSAKSSSKGPGVPYIFRVISACHQKNGSDDSIDADMSLWLGSTDLKYTERTLELRMSALGGYNLADCWAEEGDESSADNKDTAETPTRNTGNDQKIWRIRENPETSAAATQKFCGWNLIYDALEKDTSTKEIVNLKGFLVKSKAHLLLEICAQELFVALLRSMKALGFRTISELSVSESGGNIRLENGHISNLTKCFTDNALGTYSDAISCLTPILRSRILSYEEKLLAALTKAATEYRQEGRWKSAEIILRWGCQYYRTLGQRSTDKTKLMTILQELCELYRWSLAHIGNEDRQNFSKEGIQWIRNKFLNKGKTEDPEELVELVELYQKVFDSVIKKENRSGKDKVRLFSAIASRCKSEALIYICFMKIGDSMSPISSSWLPLAARNGWDEIVSVLLEIKSNPDHQDQNGRTAVSHCAKLGHRQLLRRFIDLGANLKLADKFEMTPLNYAAKNGWKDTVSLLLETYGLDIDSKMYNGRNALWFAIDQNRLDVIEYLLENGAALNTADNDGDWPLDMAVKRGLKDAVKVLLERGKEKDALVYQYSYRPTVHPLIWAAWRGFTEITKLLLGDSTIGSNLWFKEQLNEARELLDRKTAENPLRNHSLGFFSTLDIRPPSLQVSTQGDKQYINFEPRYSSPPNLMIGLSALNIQSHIGIGINWQSEVVSEKGFYISQTAQRGQNQRGGISCKVRSATAVWLEFSADEQEFQVGKSHVDNIKQIPFDTKFAQAPSVVLWFSGLNLPLKGKKAHSFCAEATDITPSGFKLVVGPMDGPKDELGDGQEDGPENASKNESNVRPKYGPSGSKYGLYKPKDEPKYGPYGYENGHSSRQFSITWLAYSPEITKVQSGISAIGTTYLINLKQKRKVIFEKEFKRTPRVFLALSGFDMEFSEEVDMDVKIAKLDTKGFSWTGTSESGDSVQNMYVNWVAFG